MMEDKFEECIHNELYEWQTDFEHSDNNVTMGDFLENHLPDYYEVQLQDGTYAEVLNTATGSIWGVHASGNGDFFNHKVTFDFIH